ncbi:FtsK/SpoIIIE domain-containing protein [Agromyces tardus]
MHPAPEPRPTWGRLSLPPHPPEPQRPGFPWLASIAPVAGSLALWAMTGSAFSLLFAALGPLVAVASALDGRRQARRMLRTARRVRAGRLDALAEEIRDGHRLEREAAWRRSPSVRDLVEHGVRPDWHATVLGQVVVGAGTVDSALRVEGDPYDDGDRHLLAGAARLGGAPILVDPIEGIGFVGAPPLARAAARSALLQCAHRVMPGAIAVRTPDHPDWAWATRLPHWGGDPGDGQVLRLVDAETGDRPGPGATAGLIAVASDRGLLPPGIRTVVRLAGPRAATLERPGDGRAPVPIAPSLVGHAEAERWADAAVRAAVRAGVGSARVELPRHVDLATLAQPAAMGSRATLRALVGVGADGPVELDLVRGGPHAIVAGTTGSGKSEFLLAWITALAIAHPPERVAFLLVDFKGGAAFEPVRSLPHLTGIVTDLDDDEAARAVASLRAELRHREGVLQAAGTRDIGSLDASVELPRLVVVVDEFQAMIERFPDVGPVIADIAARGRSLGLHLVLAAQRPNGIVREQVAANCPIRVSLRVIDRADSVAVVGVDAAAAIDAALPGRGILDAGDGHAAPFQSALVDATAIARARGAHAGSARPRRPWLDPLPSRLELRELAAFASRADPADSDDAGTPTRPPEGYLLGLADEPERQRRGIAAWHPVTDGHLLVLGAPGSGRSSVLAALEAQAAASAGAVGAVRLGGARSAVWDALQELSRWKGATAHQASGRRLLLIDDLDALFHGWPDEYRHAAVVALEGVLRSGRARGVAVAASATRLNGLGQAVRDAFGASALLRHPTRADLVHAGGDGALFALDATPGSGQWRGRRTRFAHAEVPAAPVAAAVPELRLELGAPVAVVAASPRAAADAIAGLRPDADLLVLAPGTDAGHRAAAALAAAESAGRTVIVGDADGWAANWALAGSVRDAATIVVRGGGAEYRALVRDRDLPPLLDEGDAQCWIVPPGGQPRRRGWPVARFD